MAEWTTKPLGEIADIIDSLHRTPTYSATGFPMVRVTDIKPGELKLDDCLLVDKQTFAEFNQRRSPQIGDIVFSRVGSYGISALVKRETQFCLGQNTTFIVPKENSSYLYYFLNGPIASGQIEAFVGGSTQATISLASIKQIQVPLPPIEEQQAIAEVLSSLDDKIDLLHRQNKTLESLAQTLFRQWFIEGADRNWKQGDIYELIDVIYGFPFKSKFFNEEQRGLPLIRIRDLKNGYSNIYTDEPCDDRYRLQCGDLVAGMDGEFRLYIWSGDNSVLNQRACKFQPRFDHVPPFYVFALMKPHLNFFEQTKVGTTVIHLGKADLDEIKTRFPPKSLLTEFGNLTNPLFSKLKNNFCEIRTLTDLRNSLLPKLMSGEVQVINEG